RPTRRSSPSARRTWPRPGWWPTSCRPGPGTRSTTLRPRSRPVRYVLSSGVHIAGIVNPPGPKAWYEAGAYAGASPDTWRAAASKHKGSWWEDWTAWSDARAGAHVKPPPLGTKRHPALGDAPGEYVRG